MQSRVTSIAAILLVALTIILPWSNTAVADLSDSRICFLIDDVESDNEYFPELSHGFHAIIIDEVHSLVLTSFDRNSLRTTETFAVANAIRAPPEHRSTF